MKFNGHKEMQLAIEQANIAASEGEVPIGAVITDSNGNIIVVARNRSEESGDVTDHAEMIAIREASKLMKDKNVRLSGCTLFVTLEPCAMCAAAISHARVAKLVYGARDEKGGAVENGPKIFSHSTIMHKPEIVSGILEIETRKLLQDFFKGLRQNIN